MSMEERGWLRRTWSLVSHSFVGNLIALITLFATVSGILIANFGWTKSLLFVILIFNLLLAVAILIRLARIEREALESMHREKKIQTNALSIQECTSAALAKILNEHNPNPDSGGNAYIFLKVEPAQTKTVVEKIGKEPGVAYAIGLWGLWDVVIRVSAHDHDSLGKVITVLQGLAEYIKYTETAVFRSESHQIDDSNEGPPHVCLVLARLKANKIDQTLETIRNDSRNLHGFHCGKKTSDATRYIDQKLVKVMHSVGILGRYDIAMIVLYASDETLNDFVMGYLQDNLEAETTSMPSIKGLKYKSGKKWD